MQRVGIRELKAQTSSILRRVSEQGEAIEITHHGQTIARLVPVQSSQSDIERSLIALDEIERLATEIGAASQHDEQPLDAVAMVRDVRREL